MIPEGLAILICARLTHPHKIKLDCAIPSIHFMGSNSVLSVHNIQIKKSRGNFQQIIIYLLVFKMAIHQNAPQKRDTPNWLAKPPNQCCLEGTMHEGSPRGTFVTIADIETYISQPTKSRSNGHILLYFPDVWGMFLNGLLVMDTFADAGYCVLGLDYFRGV